MGVLSLGKQLLHCYSVTLEKMEMLKRRLCEQKT